MGRAPRTEGQGYRPTRYVFEEGAVEPVAFFGWALKRRLHPNCMVILGTSGSMWDHLFEGDLALDAGEAERLALIEATEHKAVTQQQLDTLAPLLGRSLGIEVQLVLIPYCHTETEQIALLEIMARHVVQQASIHLDVTHGFRHLPMLALLAAFYLRQARQAEISGIWYGAFDPDTGSAPVHELGGLIRIAEALQALSSFDKDGDYRVFKPLLQKAGLSSQALNEFSQAGYYEAVVTRLCQLCNTPTEDFGGREQVRENYEQQLGKRPEEKEHYKLLKNLRNQVAHGTRGGQGEVQKILLQESRMAETLKRFITEIEQGRLPGQWFH